MTPYVPAITQEELDREMARGAWRARLMLQGEARAMERHIKAVLEAEGYGFLAPGKGQRREELFAACLDALRAQVDLGRFTIDLVLFGRIEVRDPEVERQRALERAAREAAGR